MQDPQLRDALVEVLEDINDQIELLADLATNMTPPCRPNEVRDMHGNYMLNPLLIAKSQILAAMAYMSPRNSFVVYNNTVLEDNKKEFEAEAQRPFRD